MWQFQQYKSERQEGTQFWDSTKFWQFQFFISWWNMGWDEREKEREREREGEGDERLATCPGYCILTTGVLVSVGSNTFKKYLLIYLEPPNLPRTTALPSQYTPKSFITEASRCVIWFALPRAEATFLCRSVTDWSSGCDPICCYDARYWALEET